MYLSTANTFVKDRKILSYLKMPSNETVRSKCQDQVTCPTGDFGLQANVHGGYYLLYHSQATMALGTAIWSSAHNQKPSTCQSFDSTCINFFNLLNAISIGSYSIRFCEQMLQLKTSNQRDNNGKPSLFMVHLLNCFPFQFLGIMSRFPFLTHQLATAPSFAPGNRGTPPG